MRILTRYLLRAHLGPFLFSLSIMTGLLLVNTVARRFEELAGKGLSLRVIVEVFVLSIPHILALTLPMAVLVAVLHAFSQLTAENETAAMKANGVHLGRLVVPLVGVAAVLAGLMVLFNDRVLPETNHALKNLLVDIGRKSPTLELKEQVINEIQTGDLRTRYFLQAASIEPASNRLWDVVIYDLSAPGRGRTVYADSGRMAFNRDRTDLFLTLYDGWVNETEERDPHAFQRLYFEEQLVRLAGVGNRLERTSAVTYRSDREMSLAMLAAEAAQRQAELADLRAQAEEETRAAVHAVLYPAGTRWRGPVADDEWQVDGAPPAERMRHLRGEITPRLRPGETTPRLRPGEAPGGPGGDLQDEAAPPRPKPLPGRAGAARRLPAVDAEPGSLPWPQQVADEPAPAAAAASTDVAAQRPVPRPAAQPGRGVTPAQGRMAARRGLDDDVARRTANELRSLNSRAEMLERRVWSFQVEYHKKYAIPFACIVFVLIGAPLAVRFPRGGVGMVIAASLTIFMIYYVGLIGGENLADDGVVPPFWAMWTPNIVFLALGLWGISRLGKEMSTTRGGGWDDLWLTVRTAAARPFRRPASPAPAPAVEPAAEEAQPS
jgi:lipopolysaccharide export system permease protein